MFKKFKEYKEDYPERVKFHIYLILLILTPFNCSYIIDGAKELWYYEPTIFMSAVFLCIFFIFGLINFIEIVDE